MAGCEVSRVKQLTIAEEQVSQQINTKHSITCPSDFCSIRFCVMPVKVNDWLNSGFRLQ